MKAEEKTKKKVVEENKFPNCKHKDRVTRKNGSFYCRVCKYDSVRDKPSGKLTNLMNRLNRCKEGYVELQEIFKETTKELQKKLNLSREIVKEKNEEIDELKLQIEAMTDE